MAPLAGFLIPLLQRLGVWIFSSLLVSLGLSFLTFTGLTLGLNRIKDYVISNFNSIPSDLFNIIMMAGVGQCVGIIFGAFAFNATMSATSRLTARRK